MPAEVTRRPRPSPPRKAGSASDQHLTFEMWCEFQIEVWCSGLRRGSGSPLVSESWTDVLRLDRARAVWGDKCALLGHDPSLVQREVSAEARWTLP